MRHPAGRLMEPPRFISKGQTMDYQTLGRESVYEGRVFNVHIDTLRTPTGSTMQVDVVEHSGAVAIVAIDENDNLLLVHQYRHPAGKTLLELPAGTLDNDEDPEDCARRESREEIGHEPGELVLLGAGYMAPGYSTELIYFFLARDLKPAPLPQDEDEDIQVKRIPHNEMGTWIASGEIADVKTIAGFSLAEAYLSAHPST
jgi:ADP-ribose pyrophosphatase